MGTRSHRRVRGSDLIDLFYLTRPVAAPTTTLVMMSAEFEECSDMATEGGASQEQSPRHPSPPSFQQRKLKYARDLEEKLEAL